MVRKIEEAIRAYQKQRRACGALGKEVEELRQRYDLLRYKLEDEISLLERAKRDMVTAIAEEAEEKHGTKDW